MTGASKRSRRARPMLGIALLMLAAAAVLNVVPSSAQEPPPPIAAEALTARSVFTDDIDLKLKIKLDGEATTVVSVDDPSRTVVARYTVQPGAQFPWHSHVGPVVVNIVSGALTYIDGDTCNEHTYSAGQAFVDPGQGHVHTAFNPGTAPMVLVATFFDAPAEGSLLIPAEPANC
jgi:quercetin dioxygenase-like cupin family protein